MSDALRQQVLGILTEEGVPILDADAEKIVIPPPGEDVSTALFINFWELEGVPALRIHAPVLLEVRAEGRSRRKVLNAVNEVNVERGFGKLVLYPTDQPDSSVIVYEHCLLGDGLVGADLVRVLTRVAAIADSLDDGLLEELGQGKRFKDMNLEDQMAEA